MNFITVQKTKQTADRNILFPSAIIISKYTIDTVEKPERRLRI